MNFVKTNCVFERVGGEERKEYFAVPTTEIIHMREATDKQLEAVALIDAARDATRSQYVMPGVGEYFCGDYWLDEEWS